MAYGYGQFRDWVDLGEELRPGLYDEQRQVLRGGGLPDVVRFDEDPTGVSGVPVGRTAAQEAAMVAEATAIAEEVAQRRVASGKGASINVENPEYLPPASAMETVPLDVVDKNGNVVGRTYQKVRVPESRLPEEGGQAKARPKQELYWAGGQRVEAPKPKIQPPPSAIERHMAGEKVIAAPPDWRRTPISRVSVSQGEAQPIVAQPAAVQALADFLRERGDGGTVPGTNDSEHAYITGALGLKTGQNVALWDIIDEGRRREERRAAYQARMGKPVSPVTPGTTPEIIERLLPLAVTGPGLEAERRARIAAADLGNRGPEVAQINDAAFPRDPEGNPAGGMQIGEPVTDPIRLEGPITRTNLWPSEQGVRVEAPQGGDPSYIDDEVRVAGDGRGGPGLIPVATVDAQGRRQTRLIDPSAETSLSVPGFDYGVEGSPSARVATVADFARAVRQDATQVIAEGPLEERRLAGEFIPAPEYELLRKEGVLPANSSGQIGTLRGQPVFVPDEGGVTITRTLPDPADPLNSSIKVLESGYRVGTKYPHDPRRLRQAAAAIAEDQGLPVIRGIGPGANEPRLRPDRMKALINNPGITLTDARTGEEIGRSAIEGEVLARLKGTPTPIKASWETDAGPRSTYVIPDPFGPVGVGAPVEYVVGEKGVIAGAVPAMTNQRLAARERKVPGVAGETEAAKLMALLASGSSSRALPTVSGGALERAVGVVDPETLRASLAASKQAEMDSFQARIQGVRDEGQERFRGVRREAQARLGGALTMALNRARGR